MILLSRYYVYIITGWTMKLIPGKNIDRFHAPDQVAKPADCCDDNDSDALCSLSDPFLMHLPVEIDR